MSKLFGRQIEPACAYCEHGAPAHNRRVILCDRKGVVAPYFSCRKFCYAPLKRIPRRAAPQTDFDPSDFSL